ncbi:transcriptional regulator with XRE-family HTH domain [Mycetocola sp. BIGb0189]|uniref:helix-turn-helix transcriptional regulator n=1 Tax=Mycetocola sp. BIGb0189 TaxID=2940604 RepID=UPI00216A82AA|nr:helix-turn-helix domain-containing protein [Mycetocola sp. BIGb0189]MCS4276755.1 transcriptional regulator with XRE-family HTH domain [Mycetocola sp. BIGb0189]
MAKNDFARFSAAEREEVAQRVRTERRNRSLTQQQLATEAGVTRQTIVNLENGVKVPQAGTLQRIMSVLDVPQAEGAVSDAAARYADVLGRLVELVPEDRREVAVQEASQVLVAHMLPANVTPLRQTKTRSRDEYLMSVDLGEEIAAATTDDGGAPEFPNG